ncbi:MAG: putative rRNA maturation factor [Candidatus Moranbacteria bacterium GW2011_GWA2_39_41]|nr:MAG: putative rRNA maturation factor [Candidatus Moranbacteria bacterium GW2011_GWA2_39_41]
MKIQIEVNNTTESPLADDFFAVVAQKTIEMVGYEFLREKIISISVALVSEAEMQKLNRENRQKDSVTDILSFCEYENISEIEKATEAELFLGELILCYDDIEKYAVEQNLDVQKELVNVASHGILHLLGFAHGDQMFGIQEEIVKSF